MWAELIFFLFRYTSKISKGAWGWWLPASPFPLEIPFLAPVLFWWTQRGIRRNCHNLRWSMGEEMSCQSRWLTFPSQFLLSRYIQPFDKGAHLGSNIKQWSTTWISGFSKDSLRTWFWYLTPNCQLFFHLLLSSLPKQWWAYLEFYMNSGDWTSSSGLLSNQHWLVEPLSLLNSLILKTVMLKIRGSNM